MTTTGSAGSAAGSATTTNIIGELLGVYLNFHASAPATTDVALTAATHGLACGATGNTATDIYLAPGAPVTNAAGSAITDSHRPFVIHDRLTITLAQCDALTNALVATVFWRD